MLLKNWFYDLKLLNNDRKLFYRLNIVKIIYRTASIVLKLLNVVSKLFYSLKKSKSPSEEVILKDNAFSHIS